jgi:hypothetical protein
MEGEGTQMREDTVAMIKQTNKTAETYRLAGTHATHVTYGTKEEKIGQIKGFL